MLKILLAIYFIIYTPETVPETAGTYKVRVYHEDENGKVESIINFTVLEENTVVKDEYAINANDFSVERGLGLTSDLVITMSQAKAWNTETLEEYDIAKVEVEQIDDDSYKATLTSIDDINTTITIKLVSDYEYNKDIITGETNVDGDGLFERFEIQTIAMTAFVLLGYIALIIIIFNYNRSVKKDVKKLRNIFGKVKKP